MYLQKKNLQCQHVTEASTYITVHYGNDIHALSRCMDSVQPRTPSVSIECILALHIRHAECSRMKHVATGQLITRREDGIFGMDHSINPRNSRNAAQHT
jgi:1,2-phenylacetyl-CoA epoxidase PaaB subunit